MDEISLRLTMSDVANGMEDRDIVETSHLRSVYI
jgi:hypothetical protein